jgi:hypothetical protein
MIESFWNITAAEVQSTSQSQLTSAIPSTAATAQSANRSPLETETRTGLRVILFHLRDAVHQPVEESVKEIVHSEQIRQRVEDEVRVRQAGEDHRKRDRLEVWVT